MSDKDSSTNTANNARIMLVDDEPDINAALSVVLKREGYDVDTFENPFIALEKLKPGFYGLIILDVKMPQMDGFELYREIKKVDRKAKICFLTASELYYENFRKEKFASLDKELFIIKPISNAELLKKIEFILINDLTGQRKT
ncbi:MAG: response regulator [Nitrososphaeraceae archaeon]